jgi:hypothetical protein
VKDESFEDTMVDVINYIVLLSAYKQDQRLKVQYGESLLNCTTRELS